MKNVSKVSFLVLVIVAWYSSVTVAIADDSVDSLRQSSKAFSSIAKAVSPSVAFIQVEGTVSVPSSAAYPSPFDEDFMRRFFGDEFRGSPHAPPSEQPEYRRRVIGQGSGFVFAVEDGILRDTTYLLTNNHVVENADRIIVRFPDGREFDAEVTGRDPQSDVAVVEIEAADIPPLELADSSKLEVGEWVVAIGNPFGLSHTLTVGVVSATGRTSIGINDYEDFIQTDAAINPGNSGGPLLNLDGQVVGINTAIFSRSGGYMGIGFAIPSNLAKSIAEQLIDNGQVTRGHLGIVIQQLTADLARSFDVEPSQGILVAQVNSESPADQAGLKEGDIIVAYDDQSVSDVGNFRNRVSLTPPGSRKQLTVVRDGKELDIAVTIGRLGDIAVTAEDKTNRSEAVGLTVQTLTPELAEHLGAKFGEGVVVRNVQAGSIAARAGIRPGAVILQVDRSPVNTVSDFERAIESARTNEQVLLLIRMDGAQRYVSLSW